LVGLFLLSATVGLQHIAGAYAAECVVDGCSHFLSGLLVHDYVATALFRNPVAFLIDFHAHYPLINIGIWPPVYYFIEGAWALVFGATWPSMLLLSATVVAAMALTGYLLVARRLGQAAALFAAAALVLSPLVQDAATQTMVDAPVAFWCLMAMVAYLRYLETGNGRWSALFGVLAAAALLTKGNGALLALLPPFVVLLGRRFDLLRTAGFWAPVPIVAVLVGPWYAVTAARSLGGPTQALTQGQGSAGAPFAFGWEYMSRALPFNSEVLVHALGPLIVALALFGFVRVCIRGRASEPLELCAAALFAAVFLFQLLVPIALQDRYLIPALAPLLILAASGCAALPALLGRATRLRHVFANDDGMRRVLFAVVLLSIVPQAIDLPRLPRGGMLEAAREIWRLRLPDNPTVLIASDTLGEQQAVADLARLDTKRPGLFAVRGTRLLGGGGYDSAQYRPRFATAAEAMAEIDRYAIPFVFVRIGGDWNHLRQIEEAIRAYPDRWQEVYRDDRHSPPIALYRIRGNDTKHADTKKLIALSAPKALSGARD
jgi:hypothetical protein